MNPQCVFFDFGGTLARQTNTRGDAIIASLVRLGYDVPRAQVGEALAAVRERYADRSPHGLTYPARQEYFISLYEEVAEALGFGRQARPIGEYLWQTQEDSYELYPDALPALQALRHLGARLGIISNWDKLNLARVCEDLGIAMWFASSRKRSNSPAWKPRRRFTSGIRTKLTLPAREALA
jgi:FMN phosphatase YigB (HAD superfamily)